MRKRQLGFTLIELLVVIAIIAILAAILYPVMARAKSTARQADCASNLNQMGKAVKMYANDWNGYLPPGGWWAPWGGPADSWMERIFKYTGKKKDIYICKETRYQPSYSFNITAMAEWDLAKTGLQGPEQGHIDYVSGSKTIWIFEISPSSPAQIAGARANEDWDLTNDLQTDGNVTNPNSPYFWLHLVPGKGNHNGGNNILFGDGHVKWFQKWDPAAMTFNTSAGED